MMRRNLLLYDEESLVQVVEQAWYAYDDAAGLSSRVNPAVPILFFGDLGAYASSELRVITVGLNPSKQEFPAGAPFSRFPLAKGPERRDPNRYLDTLSSYYQTRPYRSWFSAFEPLLNGAVSSYYFGKTSTALHTDICSPVATDPTWSKLGEVDRSMLEAYGVPLWHTLLKALKPELVFISVAEAHLGRIEFESLENRWTTLHTFNRTQNGTPRSRPYETKARWYDVGGEASLFVFGRAAQTPFGHVSNAQKSEIGGMALDAYRNGT